MTGLLIFLPVLVSLLLVHELGHFLVARANGVHVLEFGLGFPPRLLSFRRGETVYSLNLIPIAAFVRMVGEEDPTAPRSLASKSVGVRFLVFGAGPLMNALLAVVLLSAVFMVPQNVVVGQVVLQEVMPGSPAQATGLLPGDVVVEADGRTVDNHAHLQYLVRLNLGADMTWLVQRGDDLFPVAVRPRFQSPPGEGATGIVVETVAPRLERRAYPPWSALAQGVNRIVDFFILAKNTLTIWILGGPAPDVAGPIGIAQATGEVARFGVLAVVELAGLLSINLAILNVLPLPALDGGRLVFVGLEWVRRGKRISPQREGMIHLVGMAMILTLAVVISYFDIARILRGESLLP